MITPIHRDAPAPGSPRDSITEKAPSSGVIRLVYGHQFVAEHSDTIEIFPWPPGAVRHSIAHDGRNHWTVSGGEAEALPTADPGLVWVMDSPRRTVHASKMLWGERRPACGKGTGPLRLANPAEINCRGNGCRAICERVP